MVMAIREGRFEVDDLMESMSTDTIAAAAEDTESCGEKWNMLKNQVLVKLEPIIMKIFNGLGGLVEKLDPLFATLEWGVVALMAGFQTGEEGGEGFLGMMQTIGAKVAYWWPIIQDTISNVMIIIKGIIEMVLGTMKDLWERHGEKIMETVQSFYDAVIAIVYTVVAILLNFWEDYGEDIIATVTALWENIQSIIDGALDIVMGIFDTFASLFKGDWGGMWDGIKTVFAGVWNALGGIVRGALDIVKLIVLIAVDKIKDVLLGIGTAIGDAARDIWDKAWELGANLMNGIKDGVANAISSAGSFAKSIGNSIIDFIKHHIIDKIKNALKLQDDVGLFKQDVNAPDLGHIPRIRAMGGPATGPTLVGERGPELVTLPRGANVVPNHAIGAGGGASNINVQSQADAADIGREIAWAMKTSGR